MTQYTYPEGYENNLLENLSDSGHAPATRIRDAQHAWDIYKKISDADRGSALERVRLHAMRDGEPPYPEGQLKDLGQAHRCNVNFRFAESKHEAAVSGYLDLTNSVFPLATCKTKHGRTSQESKRYSDIISEEFTRTLKEWHEFEFNNQHLASGFVDDGVAYIYHDDDIDWRWRVGHLDRVKVPRGTRAFEEDIEVAVIVDKFRAHELYGKIRNAEAATKVGWNVPYTRQAIMKYASRSTRSCDWSRWEEFEKEVKDNDIFYGYARASEIEVVRLVVQEFDGHVSVYIILRTGDHKEFLYQRRSKFKNIHQALTIFTYGIGNGDIYSIRGLLYKIYYQAQNLNRLQCQLVDSTMLSTSLITQAESEDDVEQLSMAYMGALTVLQPGLRIAQTSMPNTGQNAIPVMQHLAGQMNEQTGSYQSTPMPTDATERTKFEIQTRVQQDAVLSGQAINLFYVPWERHLKEVFRRFQNKTLTANDPGGKEVMDFKTRCGQRGVPIDAIYDVSEVKAVRAIGAGSPGMRMQILQEALSLAGSYDEIGRNSVVRDSLTARGGVEFADRYVPQLGMASRDGEETEIIVLEDVHIGKGDQLPVTDGQNHFLHAQSHTALIARIMEGVQNQGIVPMEALKILGAAIPHAVEHVQRLGNDPARAAEVRQFNQILQNAEGMSRGLQNQVRKAMEAQAQQAQEAQAAQSGQIDPETASKLQDADLNRKIKGTEAMQRAQINQDKAEQQMALKDAKTAQDIKLKQAKETA